MDTLLDNLSDYKAFSFQGFTDCDNEKGENQTRKYHPLRNSALHFNHGSLSGEKIKQ